MALLPYSWPRAVTKALRIMGESSSSTLTSISCR
jgi:hypothetical protein